MQLRNRKINTSGKHSNKILHLNKKYFNSYDEQSEYSTYIDPKLSRCSDLLDSPGSFHLQIFLKNLFLGVMLFSIYASFLTYSLNIKGNFQIQTRNDNNPLILVTPDYNQKNLEGLKIVSIVFSTNNLKTKYKIRKNIKYLYNTLIKFDNNLHDMNTIYPKWISFLNNFTNSYMYKLDDYVWMNNGNITNPYSLFKYNVLNPNNFLIININRNESISNKTFYPNLIVF